MFFIFLIVFGCKTREDKLDGNISIKKELIDSATIFETDTVVKRTINSKTTREKYNCNELSIFLKKIHWKKHNKYNFFHPKINNIKSLIKSINNNKKCLEELSLQEFTVLFGYPSLKKEKNGIFTYYYNVGLVNTKVENQNITQLIFYIRNNNNIIFSNVQIELLPTKHSE